MKYSTGFLFTFIILCLNTALFSQTASLDSSEEKSCNTSVMLLRKCVQEYRVGNGKILVYTKPRHFSFITNLPKDEAGIIKIGRASCRERV